VLAYAPTWRRPVRLVRIAFLKPVVALLLRSGAAIGDLLAEASLPTWALAREESLFPFHRITHFLEAAARRTGMKHLGLLAGQQASIEDLGFAGRLMRQMPTLDEGLTTAFALASAFSSGERSWLVRDGDRAELCRQYLDRPETTYQQADQYALGLSITMLRLAAGPAWTPDHVRLQSPRDDELLHDGLLCGTRIVFDREATTVTFPSVLLACRLAPAAPGSAPEPSVREWLDAGPARDFTGSLQQVIATLTPTHGHPRIGLAATALGVSVRTLQRRLAEAGLSFEVLVRTDRLDRAARLLETTRSTVLDIALDLGYSDHAHFTRAFRRWTGLAPLAYRRARGGPRLESSPAPLPAPPDLRPQSDAEP
jgi:AraC-like DNA-binding protein